VTTNLILTPFLMAWVTLSRPKTFIPFFLRRDSYLDSLPRPPLLSFFRPLERSVYVRIFGSERTGPFSPDWLQPHPRLSKHQFFPFTGPPRVFFMLFRHFSFNWPPAARTLGMVHVPLNLKVSPLRFVLFIRKLFFTLAPAQPGRSS